jgi:hypothetical protein
MIQLRDDCLLIQQPSGETIPCSAQEVTIELAGGASGDVDPEVIRHAAAAVLHYFKVELGREFVTIAEFSAALGRVLRGFGFEVECAEEPNADKRPTVIRADLRQIAQASGKAFELCFFTRVRSVLIDALDHTPRAVEFHGLRGCVKQLMGARRWCNRCRSFEEQLVDYLRECLIREPKRNGVALLVQ